MTAELLSVNVMMHVYLFEAMKEVHCFYGQVDIGETVASISICSISSSQIACPSIINVQQQSNALIEIDSSVFHEKPRGCALRCS